MCSKPRWRKYTNLRLPYWELKVGRFVATVLDETPDGGYYVPYLNGVELTKKRLTTPRQAKTVALLNIIHECEEVLRLTENMSRKY